MLAESELCRLLAPFDLHLSSGKTDKIRVYLDLLMRWNRKISLTAVRNEEECVTRHFGESLVLSRHVHLDGRLLDIGSGAGFPGLALKIAFPALAVTLLEPIAKKRAFLKEVARACQMTSVEVRGERLDEFARNLPGPAFETATSRAVGRFGSLIPSAAGCLVSEGRLCLWVTRGQSVGISGTSPNLRWGAPIPIPLAQEREILVGTLMG